MNPARSVPGSRGTAVPAVGADSVSHHGSVLRHSPPPRIRAARHRLRRRVGARLRHQRRAATRPWVMGRSGPGPGGRLPTHIVGLFRCSREPKVSLPRRSRARRPHASRPPPRLRSTSFRALWHWKTCRRLPHRGQRERRPSLPPGRLRLQDFQHHRPTRDTRPSLGATSTGITRPKAGKKV